jgi:hypothetical protein
VGVRAAFLVTPLPLGVIEVMAARLTARAPQD